MIARRELPAQWERAGAVTLWALGGLVALAALAIGAGLAVQAGGVFGQPIPRVEGAGAGSYLLWRQAVLEAIPAWLEPLKFLAPTFLLGGIALTLSRILRTIRIRAQATEQALPGLIAPNRA